VWWEGQHRPYCLAGPTAQQKVTKTLKGSGVSFKRGKEENGWKNMSYIHNWGSKKTISGRYLAGRHQTSGIGEEIIPQYMRGEFAKKQRGEESTLTNLSWEPCGGGGRLGFKPIGEGALMGGLVGMIRKWKVWISWESKEVIHVVGGRDGGEKSVSLRNVKKGRDKMMLLK